MTPSLQDPFERFVAKKRDRSRDGSGAMIIGRADGYRVAICGLPSLAGDDGDRDPDAIGNRIAALAARRGVRLLDELHGSFALVATTEDGSSGFLAVDRVGVESLCYGETAAGVAFGRDAAEVATALREASGAGGGANELDPQAIFDYLYFHCIPAPSTVFRGVKRLLAGHVLRFGDRTVVEPYWAPTYHEDARVPLDSLQRTFIDTVESAVARAVDGARHPGCFLSGGTDSSTVAGMLTRVTGTPAECYSIGFDADGFDEMQYARIAAKRYGVQHHEYYITPADLVASIPKIAATYDQPFGNSSVLPTYYCAKMAAADGVDRLLGGDGGDELFGGNVRYAKQRVFDVFDRAPGRVKGLLRSSLAPSAWNAVPVVKKAKSYVEQADVPMPDRMQTYNLLARIGLDTIFEPSFLAQVDPDAPIEQMRAWYRRSNATTLLNRMLAFDLKYTLTDNDLPKVVTACRTAGVDVAFPFLDDAVVAFAEKLHPDLKLKGLKLRWFFKHALRDFLPPEILTKSKHGFGLPFGIWLGRDPGLNALAFASLESLKSRGIVRAAFIDALRRDLLSDHATYYGELVWVLMMLEQWLQTH